MANCGGSVGSDSPPDVEGIYLCTDGCTGTCIFDDELEINQSGDDIIIISDSFEDLSGTINNDGEISALNDIVSCEGQVVDDTAIADCTVDGTDCQQVTFTLE